MSVSLFRSRRIAFLLIAFTLTTLAALFGARLKVLAAQTSTATPTRKFSKNQMLPLPLTAGNLPANFIVRGLEPSNRTDQQGTIYVGSIRGVPGGVDMHRWSPLVDGPPNADGTLPFKYLGQPDGCGILADGCANIGVAEGGGDIDFVPSAPNANAVPNIAMTSLTLVGITGTHSTDRGNTWSQPNPVAQNIPGDDRQWMDSIGDNTVYLAYHDAATFNIDVFRSNDGGLTYTNGAGEAIEATLLPAVGGVPPTNSANLLGNIAVDKSACTSRGNLYQIFTGPDSATENVNAGTLRDVYVGVSKDAKTSGPVFTFTDHKIYTGTPGSSQANIFPAIAVDNLGNVYAVWSDNSNIWYTSSSTQGRTWRKPIVISASNSGHANVFPWVAADLNGHVIVSWLGDDRAGNSNDVTKLAPCAANSTTCMANWAKWQVFVAETVAGHISAPVFKYFTASDHVIHRGTVSTGGLTGTADRSLADYFQVSYGPQHTANIAFSDDHLLSSLTVAGHTGNDDPQARRMTRAFFTREISPSANLVKTGACATE
jgi:hypothetical protein